MDITKNYKCVDFFKLYLDNTFSILVDHTTSIYKQISQEEFNTGILKEETRKKISVHFTKFKNRTYYFVSLPQIRTFLSMLDDDLRHFVDNDVVTKLKKFPASAIAYAVIDFIITLSETLSTNDDIDVRVPDDVVMTAKELKERLGGYIKSK